MLNCNNDLVSLISIFLPPSHGEKKLGVLDFFFFSKIDYLGVIFDFNFQTFSLCSKIVRIYPKRMLLSLVCMLK